MRSTIPRSFSGIILIGFFILGNVSAEEESLVGSVVKATVSGGANMMAASGGVAAANSVLGAVGFTAQGIGAGTIAAGLQSTIGNVAAGSAFSILQSIGMTGLAVTGPVGIGAGIIGNAALYYFFG